MEEQLGGEKIIPINIENHMKTSYIDYSMSVIVARALPDVRDGLPCQSQLPACFGEQLQRTQQDEEHQLCRRVCAPLHRQ